MVISSAFSKSSLNIWRFMVHVLLKPGLKNFEHYFASLWEECNCAINPTIELPELTQDWGNRLLEGTNRTLCASGPRRKKEWPTKDWFRLSCECPGVSSRSVGQQWPAAGLRAMSEAVGAWDLFSEVTIIFITSTIVWPQVNNREGIQLHPSTENWIKYLVSMAPSIRTRPSFPLS